MNDTAFQKRLFGAATLILAVTLGAATAVAQAQPAPGRFARGIRVAMATLDLGDAQKDKVKAIFASHRDEGMALRAQAKADREALRAAASAPNPDAVLVGTAFLKVKADAKAGKARMKAVRTEIDAVLTPEQRAKLDGWIAAHRQRRGMLRGGHGQN